MLANSRLTIIVPAFNEEATIQSVLNRVFECLPDVYEVIVVDDASRDGTVGKVKEFATSQPRVRFLQHSVNQGKTAALRTGFEAANGDIIVVQDADLEYDPQEISELIAPIVAGRADVCLGSRLLVRHAGRALYYRHFLDNKFLKRKKPTKMFIKTDRGIDIAGQLLQYIRRAGRRGNDLRHPGTVLPFRADG